MPRWLCGGGCSVFHYLCSLLWSLFISRTLTYSLILFPLWLTESKRSMSRTMLLYLAVWFCCAVDSHFGYFFLTCWVDEENGEKALSRRIVSVSWMEEEGERRSRGRERELVQMNNLYRIPGIVCQGDDGRPVSKPKQTDYENTHTLSQGRVTRLLEAVRHALFW